MGGHRRGGTFITHGSSQAPRPVPVRRCGYESLEVPKTTSIPATPPVALTVQPEVYPVGVQHCRQRSQASRKYRHHLHHVSDHRKPQHSPQPDAAPTDSHRHDHRLSMPMNSLFLDILCPCGYTRMDHNLSKTYNIQLTNIRNTYYNIELNINHQH